MHPVIDLRKIDESSELVHALSDIFDNQGETIHFSLDFRKHNELSHLLCIVAAVNTARNKGKTVRIDCDTNVTYLQRINFIKS